jgi:hypothetical protein
MVWPVVSYYHRPFRVLHQRHINTDTEKQHSRSFTRTRVHWAALAGIKRWCFEHGARQSTGSVSLCQMR